MFAAVWSLKSQGDETMTVSTSNRGFASASQHHPLALLSIEAVGWSTSLFFLITYLLCIASAVVLPDWKWHEPWLQFFPGFEWLTITGFLIGFGESLLYGWYVALIFVPLYNFFIRRRARDGVSDT